MLIRARSHIVELAGIEVASGYHRLSDLPCARRSPGSRLQLFTASAERVVRSPLLRGRYIVSLILSSNPVTLPRTVGATAAALSSLAWCRVCVCASCTDRPVTIIAFTRHALRVRSAEREPVSPISLLGVRLCAAPA